jgi:catechol 2,3-dioxygenase-like lactoylglutathione lyase family enzyme
MQFYDDTLGLRDRRVFGDRAGVYRLGSSVLLIFNADETTVKQSPPASGTSGRAHTCFVVPPDSYEDWKSRIGVEGVAIIDEIEWTPPLVGRSFYFHDPAGNVLEIADRDIWPPDLGQHERR